MKTPGFIILLFVVHALHSEEDSLRVYRIGEVVVTGTRTAMAVEKLPSSVRVIDRDAIDRNNGGTVADHVRRQAGITLRGYGGNGALQSVSVRGLGSDYSLVLVDGQRFTTAQISTVDLGIMTMNDIERIEIANGGNSSLYGTNAIGGVINIITKKPQEKFSATLGCHIGSYGQSGYHLSGSGMIGTFSARGSLYLDRARNDFDFKYDDGSGSEIIRRTGADYRVKNVSVAARNTMSDNIVSNISVRYTDAHRGQPAAATSRTQNNLARILDHDLFLNSTTDFQLSSSLAVSFPITYHAGTQRYNDPNLVINGTPLSAEYDNASISLSPVFRFALSNDHMIDGGAEVAVSSIAGNEVHAVRREQGSLFIASHHTLRIPFEVIVFPSVRFDTYSDVDGDISPRLGVNIGLFDAPLIRIRSSVGRNYRVPTFNDLYWIDGGNPALKPERSVHADAGIVGEYHFNDNFVFVETNVFLIETKNKIVWQPSGTILWSPKNLQSVSSRGLEMSAAVRLFSDLLILQYHHTVLRALQTSADGPDNNARDKFLPFVPREQATVAAGTTVNGCMVNVVYSVTGYRFETADNNPRFVLPSYETVDVNIAQQFSGMWFSGRLKFEVNNITNTSYQYITGYPVPLRNYRLSAEVTL
jgi:outer membrane cobalamin receptor